MRYFVQRFWPSETTFPITNLRTIEVMWYGCPGSNILVTLSFKRFSLSPVFLTSSPNLFAHVIPSVPHFPIFLILALRLVRLCHFKKTEFQ